MSTPATGWARTDATRRWRSTGRGLPTASSTSTKRRSTARWRGRSSQLAASAGRSGGLPCAWRRVLPRRTVMAVWMRSVKVGFREAVQPLAASLARAGVQANWLTYLGFVLNAVVALIVLQGWFAVG